MTERVAHWYQSLRNGEQMIRGHRVRVSLDRGFGFGPKGDWLARCNDSVCGWTSVQGSMADAIAHAHAHADGFQLWQ